MVATTKLISKVTKQIQQSGLAIELVEYTSDEYISVYLDYNKLVECYRNEHDKFLSALKQLTELGYMQEEDSYWTIDIDVLNGTRKSIRQVAIEIANSATQDIATRVEHALLKENIKSCNHKDLESIIYELLPYRQ